MTPWPRRCLSCPVPPSSSHQGNKWPSLISTSMSKSNFVGCRAGSRHKSSVEHISCASRLFLTKTSYKSKAGITFPTATLERHTVRVHSPTPTPHKLYFTDLVFLVHRLQDAFTNSLPGVHLHVVRTALRHIAARAEQHARLRSSIVNSAARWMQMKKGTNTDLLGLSQAEQRRLRRAWRANSWIDVLVGEEHEQVDAATWRTIPDMDPWDPLCHADLHTRLTSTAGNAKDLDSVELREGLNGQLKVVLQQVRIVDGLPRGRDQLELRNIPAQLFLVFLQHLGQNDVPCHGFPAG